LPTIKLKKSIISDFKVGMSVEELALKYNRPTWDIENFLRQIIKV